MSSTTHHDNETASDATGVPVVDSRDNKEIRDLLRRVAEGGMESRFSILNKLETLVLVTGGGKPLFQVRIPTEIAAEYLGLSVSDEGNPPRPPPPPVEPGISSPHDPDMEARVTALEADMRDVNATLNRIEPKLDKLDERTRLLEIAVAKMDGKLDLLVAKMPSWWQQPVTAAAIVALMAAAVGLGKAAGWLH